MADDRVRLWTCILYPDDLRRKKYDINSCLSSLNIPLCLSPLHNPDEKTASKVVNDNEFDPNKQRKKHYHLLLAFEGKKSFTQVCKIMNSIFNDHVGWSIPMEVFSAKGLVRYFIHLDNPEKQQFPAKWQAITCYSGFKIDDYFEPSSSEKYFYIREMKRYCRDHNIYEISDLMDIADDLHPDTWGYILSMCSTLPLKVYLDSRRYIHEKEISSLKAKGAL